MGNAADTLLGKNTPESAITQTRSLFRSTGPGQFIDLPDEVWSLLFRFLNPRQVAKFALVSVVWSVRAWERSVVIDTRFFNYQPAYDKLFSKICRGHASCALETLYIAPKRARTDASLVAALQGCAYFTRLQSLHLEHVSTVNAETLRIMVKLTSLTALDLTQCCFSHEGFTALLDLIEARQLRSLDVRDLQVPTYPTIGAIFDETQWRKALSLRRIDSGGGGLFEALLRTAKDPIFEHLTDLNLDYPSNPVSVQKLAAACPSLRRLSLNNAPSILNDLGYLSQLTDLEYLDYGSHQKVVYFRPMPNFTGEGIDCASCLVGLTNLRTLKASGLLNSKSNWDVVSQLPKLTKLVMKGERTAERTSSISLASSSVTMLDLNLTQNETYAFLVSFQSLVKLKFELHPRFTVKRAEVETITSSLPKIACLHIGTLAAADVALLGRLTSLRELRIGWLATATLPPLPSLQTLTTPSQLRSYDCLGQFTGLLSLDLGRQLPLNCVSYLAPLRLLRRFRCSQMDLALANAICEQLPELESVWE